MPDETITVTLPASDWPTVTAGLLELPGKFGIPVLNKLQPQLAPKPGEPEEKPAIPQLVKGKASG